MRKIMVMKLVLNLNRPSEALSWWSDHDTTKQDQTRKAQTK